MELIVAITDNYVIGAEGAMPWHLPADLQHFKKITSNHAIAMGRRTWESIGRPLPNRLNIVISRQTDYEAEGATIVRSIEDAARVAGEERLFIIGGGEMYALVMHEATRLHLTRIHTTLEGDTSFPPIDESRWILEESVDRAADEQNQFDMTKCPAQVLNRIALADFFRIVEHAPSRFILHG
ncbi:MAG TPA: dihydrofolate reductase, partial [Methylococcaceae bacterium]|nr:dihydrofolate reductase [Methylococcaceae bacterium]